MRENKIVPFGDKFSELDHVYVSLVFDFLILQSDVQLAGIHSKVKKSADFTF